jgi:hypothetical protein
VEIEMSTTTTTTTSTLRETVSTETVLIGTKSNYLINVEYSANGASIAHSNSNSSEHSELIGSQIAGICYADSANKVYISSINNLSSYSIDYYIDEKTMSNNLITDNNGSIISFYNKNDKSLWAIQSYDGNIVKISPSDFSVIKTYENFDAPYKVRYSQYNDSYFVSGSHILWKINDATNTSSAVYEINDFYLKDFDVSENGIICMLFRGEENDIIRVLDNDIYTILFDKTVDSGTISFCKYCGAGRFYILSELNTESNIYSINNYLFSSSDNRLFTSSSENSVVLTTTTTTPATTTKAVKVTSPIGGEQIKNGEQYDIKWISSKSIGDFVKIELYKGTILYEVLSEKTENTGIFSWNISSSIEEGENYTIKITWLANNSDSNNYDSSPDFSIWKSIVTTTTTTTTSKKINYSIGIDYAPASDQILIVLSNGLYNIVKLEDLSTYGLFDLGISDPSIVATRSMVINGTGRQTKVRIFVGSEKYWSDKWDSGIIDTELKSMYYGGGNNLVGGEEYYTHIQTYSEKEGWSEIQIQKFLVPK